MGISALLNDRRNFSVNYHEKQQKLEIEWEKYFHKYGFGAGIVEDRQLLRALILKGIPDKFRGFYLNNYL